MTEVLSIDPRTGTGPAVAAETSPAELLELTSKAHSAFLALGPLGRGFRARLLGVMATELESRRAEIVDIAHRETAIVSARLNGELTRTCYQMRLFAQVIDDGGYLEATIDHAGPTPMGDGPDLRRWLIPIGPVAVFGAANFPLAFSVPGGDTVSALAAGCPVLIKAHSSHPATSLAAFAAMTAAADSVGAPAGTLGLVFGQAAGAALVADPLVKAVGFTGSLPGGRTLMDIIAQRPEPIPFYGELSSLNPIVVTAAAAKARGNEIAAGLVASFTVAAGQLCTKPGLIFVPSDQAGDDLLASMRAEVRQIDAQVLLNERIMGSFTVGMAELTGDALASELGEPGDDSDTPGGRARATLLTVRADELTERLLQECFGPVTVVARYEQTSDLQIALTRLPGSLTATIHCEPGEDELVAELTGALTPLAGRLIFNGYPTGVLVSWAQHHGGPWPSTNTLHTSVGASAIRRFLRPIVFQSAPKWILPAELRDGFTAIPRRVDGVLEPARLNPGSD